MKIGEVLREYNIECSSAEEEKLLSYMEEVLRMNESINLTAIKDPEEFVLKHYVDSLSLLSIKEYERAGKVLDLGTGGGFPGVPLAIFSPDKDFTLLDSLKKRLKVIDEMGKTVGLSNITLLHGRAEDLGRNEDYRESFDLCASRAVADLSVLSEYCLPFVSPGGTFVAYKGPAPEEEVENAKRAIEILGGELDRIEKTGLGQSLVVIKKIKKTPKKYPRKAGDPKRKPL